MTVSHNGHHSVISLHVTPNVDTIATVICVDKLQEHAKSNTTTIATTVLSPCELQATNMLASINTVYVRVTAVVLDGDRIGWISGYKVILSKLNTTTSVSDTSTAEYFKLSAVQAVQVVPKRGDNQLL
jgi:hypothetical protein